MFKRGSWMTGVTAALLGAGCNSEGGGGRSDNGTSQGTGMLLVAATDYSTQTEIVAVDLATNATLGTAVFEDGNAVPQQSAGVGYLLERTNDLVHRLDESGAVAETFDVGDAEGGTNVNRVLTVSSSKAYAALYKRNRVDVLALGGATLAGSIDLSAFHDSADTDLAIDLQDGLITPAQDRAYFVAARIDTNSILADPEFRLSCTETPALLIGIDTESDSVVDLNGDASGEAIELVLKSPSSIAFDASGDALYVSSAGCFADGARTQHGVERVDLAQGTSSVMYAPSDQNYHGQLLVTGPASAVLETADDTFESHWLSFTLPDFAEPVELVGMPDTAQYDKDGSFVGLALGTAMTLDVVRYDATLSQSETLVEAPWTEDLTSPAGSALVR